MGIIETIIRKIELTIGIIVITIKVLPQHNLEWLKEEPRDLKWLMFGINKNIESIGRIVYEICSVWFSYDRWVERIKRESEEYERRN